LHILINVSERETRVAMVENGIVQEVIIERTSHHSLVGNIYKGRVCRVLPGMQAAFVDIGLERAAFLHTSDILHESQTLLVQVIKEPIGTKGAHLTTQISIPSPYLVFLPYSKNATAISNRIESVEERKRLKEIVLHDGFIIRTAAEGVKDNLLRADMDFLCRLWKDIREKEAQMPPCSLIYKELSLALRTVRDFRGEKLQIDSQDTFREVVNFAEKFIPDLVPYIEHYTGEVPLFDLYSIDDEITKALQRKVELKSGGYIVIDETEAMTTIDVNTGAYVGSRNFEETILKTNLEAAEAIGRQLRLRNLGGIIILDFIDMQAPEHRRQVLQALEKCLERDRCKSYISEVSSLGLVQMTRKRSRESLAQQLCETCPTCGGRGTVRR
jgi:ribonuclease G